MLLRYFNRLAEANLVDSSDAALVLGLVYQVLDGVAGVLQVPGYVAADPIRGVCPLALHQVADNGASTIVCGGGPGESNGAVGCVRNTRVHNRARRIWGREN